MKTQFRFWFQIRWS